MVISITRDTHLCTVNVDRWGDSINLKGEEEISWGWKVQSASLTGGMIYCEDGCSKVQGQWVKCQIEFRGKSKTVCLKQALSTKDRAKIWYVDVRGWKYYIEKIWGASWNVKLLTGQWGLWNKSWGMRWGLRNYSSIRGVWIKKDMTSLMEVLWSKVRERERGRL